MYHSLILEDLVDLTNLRGAYPGLLPDWSEPAGRMVSWLRQMIHPDGRISFFNDATFGVAPEPEELFAYADRLGIEQAECSLSDSGYRRLVNGETVVLFDAGPIGPEYQPGHAHADTLSFELSHRGKRLLVNSGISTYERGLEREQQRSTAAHNTLRVDGTEQSDVWAAFRVGRRARPRDVKVEGSTCAEAAHDGYMRLRGSVLHRRKLVLEHDRLMVTDSLEGKSSHRAECFFHIHPRVRAGIQLDPKLIRCERDGSYHPGFDGSVPNKTVVGHWTGECPVKFVSQINLC